MGCEGGGDVASTSTGGTCSHEASASVNVTVKAVSFSDKVITTEFTSQTCVDVDSSLNLMTIFGRCGMAGRLESMSGMIAVLRC